MYVLAASEKLLYDLISGKNDSESINGLKTTLTPEYISSKRKEIYDLFIKMIEEKKK